jgi:hypothetical protein
VTVFLGVAGYVELTRDSSDEVFTSLVNPSDVNTAKDRFSFDFPNGMLLTGDRIEITATDGGLLTFVTASGWINSTQQNKGSWYINVDELGGIKLYDSFATALNGETTGRISLATPERDIPIGVSCVSAGSRILGKVTSYELNNSRDAVDVTALSEEFRQQQSGLISGSGSITCIFDYRTSAGTSTNSGPSELAAYMHQLLLRQQLGARFRARLFVVSQGYGSGDAVDDSLWFEFDAVVTNAGIALQPDAVTNSTFDFVTTGVVALKAQTATTSYLLQQSDDYILLEQDTTGKLELEYQ